MMSLTYVCSVTRQWLLASGAVGDVDISRSLKSVLALISGYLISIIATHAVVAGRRCVSCPSSCRRHARRHPRHPRHPHADYSRALALLFGEFVAEFGIFNDKLWLRSLFAGCGVLDALIGTVRMSNSARRAALVAPVGGNLVRIDRLDRNGVAGVDRAP